MTVGSSSFNMDSDVHCLGLVGLRVVEANYTIRFNINKITSSGKAYLPTVFNAQYLRFSKFAIKYNKPPSAGEDYSNNKEGGMVIGAVIGAVVGVLVLGVIIFFFYKKYFKQKGVRVPMS